jgi:hypothetical protein
MYPSLLRSFRHPLVIFSILILLLNDHVLKATSPSWLTGKLSDFAGLFFFPFLAGVVIQAAAGFRRPRSVSAPITSRRFLLAGILFTALMFAAIKTIPAANGFAVYSLSALFGMPVRIVRDPTDLLALAVLAPAWLLWRRIQAIQPSPVPGKLAYAALGLSALASLATAPCPSVASIQYLVAANNTLYASTPLYPQQPVQGAYISRDDGKTWTWENDIPAEVGQKFIQPVNLPFVLCDPTALQTCYRIDGQPRVDESHDGGHTWQIAWEIPASREQYIQRAATRRTIGGQGCGKTPDLRTFDMLFTLEEGGSKLLVAMGNEGLLIHTAGAGWQRTEIAFYANGAKMLFNPAPTDYAARSFDEALQNTQPEWVIGLAIAYLAYLLTSALAWVYAAFHASTEAKPKLGWVFSPTRLLAILVLVLLAGWLSYTLRLLPMQIMNTLSMFWLLAVALVPLVILVLSIIIWVRAGALISHHGAFSRLAWAALLLGALVFLITWAGFMLWAFNVVPVYETAQIMVIALIVVIYITGILWVLRSMRRMVKGE